MKFLFKYAPLLSEEASYIRSPLNGFVRFLMRLMHADIIFKIFYIVLHIIVNIVKNMQHINTSPFQHSTT